MNNNNYSLKSDDMRSMFYPESKLYKKKLQWFSWEEIIDITPQIGKIIKGNINVFVVNLQKNVGKTFWMIKQTNGHTDKVIADLKDNKDVVDRFGVMFRSKEIKGERASEINNNEDYKWKIVGNKILSKGRLISIDDNGIELWEDKDIIVGTAITFNTLGNASGGQYKGHKNCYYDEYRSKINIPLAKREKEYSQWVIFMSNFQRGKEECNFFLFGNNEPGADYILEGVEIDKDTDYMIDIKLGLMYINLPLAFSGLSDEFSISAKWSGKSESTQAFIKSNIALESKKGMTSQKNFIDKNLWGFLLSNGMFYKIQIDKKVGIWYVEKIEERQWMRERKQAITLGITTEDICYSPYVAVAGTDFIKSLMMLFRFDKLLFWSVGARDSFTTIWTHQVSSNFFRSEFDKNTK